MKRSPLVSVVIANYNYGRFLSEALDSVLAQTYENLEIVVVDDGSTDESRDVLRSYEDRARILVQGNRGVSAARNHGAAESRGELLAFLDSDDVWLPEKLERQLPLFADPEVGMVYTGLRYVDEGGRSLRTSLSGSRGKVLLDIALLNDPGVPASGSSAVVRRSVFERTGGFDEALSTSADWDMWRRIACHCDIDIVREPLVHYRQHGEAMHTNVTRLEQDMLHAFRAMFEDEAAHEVHPLKRRCYGNLHLTLAGSYLHAGDVGRSLRHLWTGLSRWPLGLPYVLATPIRRIARRLGVGMSLQVVGRTPHT